MSFSFVIIFSLIAFTYASQNFNNERKAADLHQSYEKCSAKHELLINEKDTKYDESLKPINFFNYDKQESWTISFDDQNLPTFIPIDNLEINGSDFNNSYLLWKAYLTVSGGDKQDIKYAIDDKKHPLELRLVYVSILGSSFAVSGFLFKQDHEDNPGLKEFLNVITSRQANSTSMEGLFKLSSILPPSSNLHDYYRYESKTNNTQCEDPIKLTVFEEPILISSKQLDSLKLNIPVAPTPTTTTKTSKKRTEARHHNEIRRSRKPRETRKTLTETISSSANNVFFSYGLMLVTVLGFRLIL